MLAATGKPAGRPMFEPMTPGFVNVPYGDIAALRAATTARTAAVMLEPVQGEGGVIVPEHHYLDQAFARLAHEQSCYSSSTSVQLDAAGSARCSAISTSASNPTS